MRLVQIVILIIQIVITLLTSVYLLVPVYQFTPTEHSGSLYHNPYENWERKPLTSLYNTQSFLTNDSEDTLFTFESLDRRTPLWIPLVDNAPTLRTFYLGYSRSTLQYLINHRKSEYPHDPIIYRPSDNPDLGQPPLYGIDLMEIKAFEDQQLYKFHLKNGRVINGIARAENTVCENRVPYSKSVSEQLVHIKNGSNLMVFYASNKNDSLNKHMPAIRRFEWKNQVFSIDLSQKGDIRINASDFVLDTTCQNLSIKMTSPAWFYFSVTFPDEGLHFLSNPIFKIKSDGFSNDLPKPDNRLTVFVNLVWLLGIIMINYLLWLISKKWLKNEK